MFSGLQVEILDALNNAGEGFGECGVEEGEFRGYVEEVAADDAGRNDDGLGVGPVEEEEVVAKVGLAPAAGRASLTRSRVRGHDPITRLPVLHGGMNLGDDPGELMPEDAGWSQHAGVVSAPEHLEVRATGQGGPDADANLAFGKVGFGQFFDSDILLPMEHGGAHSRKPHGHVTCGAR